jgi:predicted ATP-binding protein involved in virulence
MYIKKVEIENIRSISKFSMEFEKPAGWHVIIGDNGSGKSSLLKSIAISLLGEMQANGLRIDWMKWLKKNGNSGLIKVELCRDKILDEVRKVLISEEDEDESTFPEISENLVSKINIYQISKSINVKFQTKSIEGILPGVFYKEFGWFGCGFGPFRRFSGGNKEWDDIFKNQTYSRLASYLTLFREDISLSEITEWLKSIQFKNLENGENQQFIESIVCFINQENFLPNNTKLNKINSDGVFFRDSLDNELTIEDLSDGFRSILSLTLEIIRQMVMRYGQDNLFEKFESGIRKIELPGVILIDEIDAHLHPTWQTRIGQWFTKYFPNIQFIVTTHSPLICRAAENGTIWRLSAPGSNEISGEVIGIERERLIYGNVLDAYGTEVFGKSVSISKTSSEKLQRLGELNIKSLLGDKLTKKEIIEFQDLKSVFPTENLETQR